MVAAGLSMSALMPSSHLVMFLELLSVGALVSRGLVRPGLNACSEGGGMVILVFLED